MDRSVFNAMAEAEDRHWWFVARRKILADQIERLNLPAGATILEAGCGSGGNLAMLARFGRVHGFELDLDALKHAQERSIGQVESGRLPDGIPFGDEQFDLIVSLDVMEHLANDAEALAALVTRLKPGGHVLIAVPAIEALWSQHDIAHHHFRRYSKGQLKKLIKGAGLQLLNASYFNYVLFPFVVAGRVWERIARPEHSVGLKPPTEPINSVLTAAFAAERFALRHLGLPIGSSVLAVGRKS